MNVINLIDGLFGIGISLRLPLDAPSFRVCQAGWTPRHLTPEPGTPPSGFRCQIPGGWPGNTASLRITVQPSTVELKLDAILGNPGIPEAVALMADALRAAGGQVEHASLSFYGDGCGAEHEGSLDPRAVAVLLASARLEFSPAFDVGRLPVLVRFSVEARDDRLWLERP